MINQSISNRTSIRLDPRLLILTVLFSSIFILINQNLLHLVVLCIYFSICILFINSRTIIKLILISTLSLFLLLLIYSITQVLTFHLLMIMFFRLISFLSLYILFYLNVLPEDMTKALMYFKIPYRQSWYISIAYRYIFLFSNDMKELKNALIIRGVNLHGNILKKLKSIPILLTLFLFNTNNRSIRFAEILFAKNWSPMGKKTFYRPLKFFNKQNIIFLMTLMVLYSVLLLDTL